MKKSFFGLLWSSFLRIQGGPIASIAVILAVLLWMFAPNENISLGWVLPLGLFCIILILTLSNAAYESLKMSEHILPRIVLGKKPSVQIQGAKVLCLLESSELFSYDALVSFYYIDDENFEQLIGIGAVVNIQEDRKIQVAMFYSLEGHQEKAEKIAQNDAGILKKTRVKPNVPKTYLDMIVSKIT